jgi:transposase-like protein
MPTRKHLAYLECWLDPTQPKNMSQIARALGISRRTIAGWLQQDDFRAWFTEEMDRHIDHHWTPALLKVTQLAIAGSAEHFKLLAQVRGALRSESDQRVGVQVIVGIPRPGDHVPVPADAPRPGLPPATSEQDH